MKTTVWIAAALAATLIAGLTGAALGQRPGPVILDLGPIEPTPPPTPNPADRRRLVSTVTVQNHPTRESNIQFEVTDMADEGEDRLRLFAAKTYTMSDEELAKKPEARALAAEIIRQIRALERDMLYYADMIGPPEERRPLTE